jgi:hypothetical protein
MISLAFSRAGSRTNASAPTISIIKSAISYHKFSLTPFTVILQLTVACRTVERIQEQEEEIT